MEKRDISRFPQWLQQYVKSLEQKVERYQRKIDEMTGNKPTNTVVLQFDMDNINKDIPLENNATVRFKLSDGGYIDVGIYEDEVRVYSGGRLQIIPQASNSIIMKA